MKRGQWWMLLWGGLGTLAVLLGVQSASATDAKVKSAAELAAFIDARIAAEYKKNNITPAPLAEDAEYFRRVSLDLVGRIPRVSAVRNFLEEKSTGKRRDVVDELLKSPKYINHFTNTWRALLLPKQNNFRFNNFAQTFDRWLIDNVRNNTAYDKMVRELLTAPINGTVNRFGGIQQPGAANAAVTAFYQANELKAENIASATSRIFLGVRLECAQCHDHPMADWTREQFWEYTAFFSRIRSPRRIVRPGQPVQPPLSNVAVNLPTMKIPGTKREVNARFLDGKVPYWDKPRDPREVLADWMTSSKNPYFARTAVNRLWGHFFGHGLIDPIDDEPSEENPISHPVLLKELARQFVAHKYDVKYIIRAITQSKAYQRTSRKTHESQDNPRLFARMAVRGLTAEQLWDSLAQATGYYEQGRQISGNFFVNQRSARGRFLNQFSSTDRATEKQTSILQALALMNGAFVADATSVERSKTLGAVVNVPFFSTKDRLETLYLATLSRLPRADELHRLTAYVNSGGPRENEQAALADVFWALLNSSEFTLNH